MEGGNLFEQLGIHWQLFLSQAVNFFILLVILTFFVYKPLLAVIKKRNERIAMGLQKAAEADTRLKEVDLIAKNHLKKADQEALDLIRQTELRAHALAQTMQEQTLEHEKKLMAQAQAEYLRLQKEMKNRVFKESMQLIKATLIKTVELDPKHVDEALINKAIVELKKHEL